MTQVTYLGNSKTFLSNELDSNWTCILDTKAPVESQEKTDAGVSPATKNSARGKRRRSQSSLALKSKSPAGTRTGSRAATRKAVQKQREKGAESGAKGAESGATKAAAEEASAPATPTPDKAPAQKAAAEEAPAPAYVVCSKDHAEVLGLIQDRDFEKLHGLAKEAFENAAAIETPAGSFA